MTKKKSQAQKQVMLTVTEYPQGTEHIFVCGNLDVLGGWDSAKAVEMEKQKDGTFQYSFTTKSIVTVEYKYLSARNWANVERGIVTTDIENRSFTTNSDKSISDTILRF